MARVMGSNVAHSLRLASVWALVTGLVVAGSPARACSCAPMDLRTRLPGVDGAFIGTFVDREPIDERRVAITFEVERVIEGEFGPRAIVRTDASGASCGIEFLGGPRTGLLLDLAADGVWESGLCQQVTPDELLSIRPGALPPDPTVDPIDPSTALPWWLFAAVGAVAVGGILALAARARPAA